MVGDWPDEGIAAAAEIAEAWRDEFIRCRRRGDDDGWAAHFADNARDRYLRKLERQMASEGRLTPVREGP